MPRSPRPSITDIAAAVGVSAMAVSYALRGQGHVSTATREKILREARRLGYRPDPLLTHLMSHVRSRRIRHTQANLGLLAINDDDYTRQLIAGVGHRAAQLGFVVDKIDVEPFADNPAGLTRMLQARGITGLLLPPGRVPQSLAGLLDWNQFATVAMTYSITEPRFHRVVPHHFHNATLVLRVLREHGYARPAFAFEGGVTVRANHAYTGALAADAAVAGATSLPPFVGSEGLRGLAAWVRTHRPDALIVTGTRVIETALIPELGEAALRRLGLAVMHRDPHRPVAGIDQKIELLGATAVDTLVAQLHRHERGAPADPVVSMIEGAWVAGATVRLRPP
jgi:DNA-binding LacI/PurR family transcriptional regulator